MGWLVDHRHAGIWRSDSMQDQFGVKGERQLPVGFGTACRILFVRIRLTIPVLQSAAEPFFQKVAEW